MRGVQNRDTAKQMNLIILQISSITALKFLGKRTNLSNTAKLDTMRVKRKRIVHKYYTVVSTRIWLNNSEIGLGVY